MKKQLFKLKGPCTQNLFGICRFAVQELCLAQNFCQLFHRLYQRHLINLEDIILKTMRSKLKYSFRPLGAIHSVRPQPRGEGGCRNAVSISNGVMSCYLVTRTTFCSQREGEGVKTRQKIAHILNVWPPFLHLTLLTKSNKIDLKHLKIIRALVRWPYKVMSIFWLEGAKSNLIVLLNYATY